MAVVVDAILVKALKCAQEHLGSTATVSRMHVLTAGPGKDAPPSVVVWWDVGVAGNDGFSWSILGRGRTFREAITAAVKQRR